MIGETFDHGFPQAHWEEAKNEAAQVIKQRAHERRTVYYSELSSLIKSVKIDAHGAHMNNLLGEISAAEHEAHRPLITAVVVRKKDKRPGNGFYHLAESLGFTVTDPEKFWIDELHKVYGWWGS